MSEIIQELLWCTSTGKILSERVNKWRDIQDDNDCGIIKEVGWLKSTKLKKEGKMIQSGFCLSCGHRFDTDPDRPHNNKTHYDCSSKFTKIFQQLGVRTYGILIETSKLVMVVEK